MNVTDNVTSYIETKSTTFTAVFFNPFYSSTESAKLSLLYFEQSELILRSWSLTTDCIFKLKTQLMTLQFCED